MAFGDKLGKVFGAIGSGLSFIPGPWSALGAVFGAAGTASSMVAQKREAEQQEQQEQKQQPAPAPQPDNQRPGQAQLETNQPAPQMPSGNVLSTQQATGLGGYQSQMQSAVANLILKGDINDLGGV